jgi:hypothetical protein
MLGWNDFTASALNMLFYQMTVSTFAHHIVDFVPVVAFVSDVGHVSAVGVASLPSDRLEALLTVLQDVLASVLLTLPTDESGGFLGLRIG